MGWEGNSQKKKTSLETLCSQNWTLVYQVQAHLNGQLLNSASRIILYGITFYLTEKENI